MKFVRYSFLLALALLITQNACADTANADSRLLNTASVTAMPAFTRNATCLDFINENPQRVTCGFIELPLNHNEKETTTGTITLPILIAGQTQSLSATPSQKAILIPGGGGPGASIGFGLPYRANEYLEIYSSLRAAGFDLVILDQRGTGLAKPVLRCPETATAFINSVAENQSFTASLNTYRESLNNCRDRLVRQSIPLQNFDTFQSAKDFLAVIKQLPYEWWGVLATSYATVLAQEMEVLQPSVFDRIVLDSPVAIDYQRPFTFELSESSIERVLSLCEITLRCNRRHKDIKTKFQKVRSRFKQQPMQVDVEIYDDNNTVQRTTLQVDDATLLDMLILAAYSNYGLAEIPWIIDGLYRGKIDRLKQLASDYWHYNTDLDFATALSWVIHCKERQPMEEAYLRKHPDIYDNFSEVSKTAFDLERLTCTDWHTESQPGSSNQDGTNALITTETLILAGDLDPVINRDDISNTADNFKNKHIMIIPGTGHSVWFQSTCTRQNVASYFSNSTNSNLQKCKDGISRFR